MRFGQGWLLAGARSWRIRGRLVPHALGHTVPLLAPHLVEAVGHFKDAAGLALSAVLIAWGEVTARPAPDFDD